MLIFIVGQN
jgi:ATP-binding cassette subfamily A (ABC1) protein 3